MDKYEAHYEDHGYEVGACPICDDADREFEDELAAYIASKNEAVDPWIEDGLNHHSIGNDPWAAARVAGFVDSLI